MEFYFSSAKLINVRCGESSLQRTIYSRKNNLLLFKLSGITSYNIGEKTFVVQGGDIILIPDSSDYWVWTSAPGGYIAVTFSTEGQIELATKQRISGARELFERLYKAFSSQDMNDAIKCRAIFYDILYRYALTSRTSKANETGYLSREASEIINKACAEIEEKYNDPDFRLSNLHEKYGISAVYLCKLFKKAKEMSPSDYLARIRLEKSKALLGLGYGVSKTAYAVGFLDPLYFSRFFKKHTGYSPSEYFDIFSE